MREELRTIGSKGRHVLQQPLLDLDLGMDTLDL